MKKKKRKKQLRLGKKSFVEQKNEAKQKLAKNKWVLLALVAGGGLIVMLFIGLIYDAVVKTGSQVLEKTSVVAKGEAAQENEPQAAAKTPEQELAEMKAQIALVKQQGQMKAVADELDKEDTEATQLVKATPQPAQKPQTIAEASQKQSPPRASTTARPGKNQSQPAQKAKSSQPPTTHTFDDWMRLASLGDFGHIDYGEKTNRETVVQVASRENQRQRTPVQPPSSRFPGQLPKALPKYVEPETLAQAMHTTQPQSQPRPKETKPAKIPPKSPKSPINSDDLPTLPEPQPPQELLPFPVVLASSDYRSSVNSLYAQQPINPEELNILQGRRRQRIQIGQQARAHLVTPLLWVAAQEPSQENFVVELDEPIWDTRGQVLLPVGTQILLKITTVHPSGLVISQAHTLLKDGVEYSLPPGVLRIRGESGTPLIASLRGQAGGKIAGRDTFGFTVGALGKVGEVLNRPEREISTFSSSGFSQTVTDNGSPDLMGAVLEGGFQPLSKDIQHRNRQATERLLSRPQIWELDAGESVQVFVNGTFEL